VIESLCSQSAGLARDVCYGSKGFISVPEHTAGAAQIVKVSERLMLYYRKVGFIR